MKKRVLVIGLNGVVGGAIERHLADRYELSSLGRRPMDQVESHVGDITDLASIRPAFAGKDVVVHLASALPRKQATWNDYLQTNIIGTYNVFEAAREAKIDRIVFASSGAVVSGYERVPPYDALVAGASGPQAGAVPLLTEQAPTWPGGLYGVSKVFGEALGHSYADQHGLSVLCLRIGQVNEVDRPDQPRSYPIWLSQRDCAQAIQKCVDAPASLRFDVFFATSRNQRGYRSLEHARTVLGFEPVDSADTFS